MSPRHRVTYYAGDSTVRVHLAIAVTTIVASGCASHSAGNGDQWTFRTRRPMLLAGDSEARTPALAGDRVFFCGGYFWNGWSELHALDATTGHLQWHVPVGRCQAPPIVVGSTVVQLASQDHGSRHVAYGLAADSGRTIWTRDLGEPAFHAAVGEFVYVAVGSGPLQRINAATGDVETVDVDSALKQRLWIAGTNTGILIGAGPTLWRISASAEKPARVATLQTDAKVVDAVVSDGDLLLIQDRDNQITAYGVDDGRVLWNRRFNRILGAPALLANPVYGAPSIANGHVFVNTFGQNRFELIALDARTGNPAWSAHDGSFEAPSASGGDVLMAGQRAVLIVDQGSGQITARIPAPAEVTTSPQRYGNLLIFGTIDGALHAVRAR